MRAKRELEKLRREEAEEAAMREADAEEREREAAERREVLNLERARLERQERQERERRRAEEQLAAFRCRWLNAGTEALSANEFCQLSAVERKEILDGLEAEINRRTPQDEPRMLAILRQSIAAVAEPIFAARKTRKRRQEAAERALWHFSAWATDSEKAQASEAARRALAALPADASETELRAAAEKAIKPGHQAVEKRLLDGRVLTWVGYQLPWDSDEQDKLRLRRECAEILAGLPDCTSELEAKAALESIIAKARQRIAERQEHMRREERKAALIQQGLAEISNYLWQLRESHEITTEEFLDSDFRTALQSTVTSKLERELSGEATTKEVNELVREVVRDGLG